MGDFHYYHPIEVRYGDLDPQGHVNNARHFTYLEQARVSYVKHLGLWDGRSFYKIGFILADAHLVFQTPIRYGMDVRVGVRITRLGNKSLTMEYKIDSPQDNQVFATGDTILVTYDYQTATAIPIPPEWRRRIIEFEGLKSG